MPIVKPKIIILLGTTASGKTKLGVKLAAELNGEIVSADSRQVYKYMDVGTGKDLPDYEYQGKKIPYHLIDVVEPSETFDLAQYQKLAFAAIDDILKRGKLPIIVGGSGLYLQAIVDNYQLTTITKPDLKQREDLENKSLEELQALLKSTNQAFFEKLNNSDVNNKRRLIRYLEIYTAQPVLKIIPKNTQPEAKYDYLLLGLTWPKEVLEERIQKRLIERLEQEDMIQEVSDLHDKHGLEWKKLESFGLEYKFISWYLQEKIDYEQMIEQIFIASRQFAKRQMTWFKRWEKQGKVINWLENQEETLGIVNDFIKN